MYNPPPTPYLAMPKSTIRYVHIERIDLPLFEPFVIATGQFSAANSVIIRIELENGIMGFGEASPSLSSGGETAATIEVAAREMGTTLIGKDAGQWRTLAEYLQSQFKAHSCARAGIEMALLDAITKTYTMPLYRYFGGASTFVETDMTIPIVTPDQARDQAIKIVNRGITTIKVKVGTTINDDEARLVAIHSAAPNANLLLDGNQGYDAPGALQLLERLARRSIVPILFEQPAHKDDWKGMAEITARSNVPIAADEMVQSPADALRVIMERAAHVINIKLMKSTFLGALDIVGIARASHTGLMIGAMMESRMASAAAAHFVAGIGGFSFVDLDTPMLINGDPFRGGYVQNGARYELGEIRAGHGVERW